MSSSDGYARATIRAGRDLGIAPRGIVIGLAVELVEAGPMRGTPPGPILMYANRKVPESLALPHDAVGDDGYSVGTFQQQIRRGTGGEWWWGDVKTCMDPYLSALLFFERLAKRDYLTGDPGTHAQAVQGSAYPDRYGQRMAEAQKLYDRLAGEEETMTAPFKEIDMMTGGGRSSRFGARISYWLLHTEEGYGNDDPVRLGRYCNGANNVSYHYTAGRGVVCDLVDTDYASWSVLNANPYSINLCFAGSRASMTRDEWMKGYKDDIRNAAFLAVQDAKKYGFAIEVIGTGGKYSGKRQGFADHRFVTDVLRIGTHTDVGKGFPLDWFAQCIKEFTTGVAPKPVENQINKAATKNPWLGTRLTKGELVCPDKRGRMAHFAAGSVYWTPTTGARAVPLLLMEAWGELKWETGPLGYPVANYTRLPGGLVQGFEGGVLYLRDNADNAAYVTGRIGAAYARNGYENGPLGWVVSNEIKNADGTVSQVFENGVAYWSPDGVITLSPVGGQDVVMEQKH